MTRKELKCKNFIGGAGIVAAHINSLGAKCDFISVIGKDDNAEILKKENAFVLQFTIIHLLNLFRSYMYS